MTTALQNIEETFASTVLKSWENWVGRVNQLFASLTDEEMLRQITPGKNRPIYLLGHLIAVNDSMIPQLRLGEANYSHLRKPFIEDPDRGVSEFPPIAELRQNWTDLNARLDSLFKQLSPTQWLERHAILLSRTNHTSYHLGQLMLRIR